VQIHKQGDDVRVYTRTLNDVSVAVPEIVELTSALPARALILDGEAIALRPDGSPLPFQVTMRRFGRRLDVDSLRAELPLTMMAFDALHADGRDLIDLPAEERLATLSALLPPGNVIPSVVTEDTDEGARFLDAARPRGHEGVLAKHPRSLYEA